LFLTSPEKAAETIIHGIKKNKRRVLIGPDAQVLNLMQHCLPGSYQKLVSMAFKAASA